MTKEITKAYILQELQDMFKLREYTPESFLFSETVLPTYDITSHLQKREIDYNVVSITSGPTEYVFFTVPQNERWILHRYNVVFLAAGAYKVTGVFIYRGLSYIYLDMTEGQTVSYLHDLINPVVLDPGDRIVVYVDDYTSTADLRLRVDLVKESIR